MTIYLTEADVQKLLTMKDTIDIVEDAMKEWGEGRASNSPRTRAEVGDHVLNVLAAGIQKIGTMGFKAYTTFTDGTRGTTFLINIYDSTTGDLSAMVQAGTITRTRTGAATAVATKYLARRDSKTLGLIGAGRIGELQVAGLMAGGKFTKIMVYDFIQEARKKLVEKLKQQYSVDCAEALEPSELVGKSDVVVTATSSEKPVLEEKYIVPGVHINAVGSNSPKRAELAEGCFAKASMIVVDYRAQCMLEAGDLIRAVNAKKADWAKTIELPELVAHSGKYKRGDKDVTIFKSVGLAIEDVAVAKWVAEKAKREGAGTQVPVA